MGGNSKSERMRATKRRERNVRRDDAGPGLIRFGTARFERRSPLPDWPGQGLIKTSARVGSVHVVRFYEGDRAAVIPFMEDGRR
jgi:hypothetical protein